MSKRLNYRSRQETDFLHSGIIWLVRAAKKALEQEMVEPNGFEPLTPCLQSRCSTN
jgi:hypothetical protein